MAEKDFSPTMRRALEQFERAQNFERLLNVITGEQNGDQTPFDIEEFFKHRKH